MQIHAYDYKISELNSGIDDSFFLSSDFLSLHATLYASILSVGQYECQQRAKKTFYTMTNIVNLFTLSRFTLKSCT
jgi:hypothetical protein